MIKRIALCLVIALSVQTAFASLAARKNLGLFGGMIEHMSAFDLPGTPNRIYADVMGANALYYTDNEGLNWTLSIFNEDTYGLATDSNYVYVVVNGMEIWRSNGGDGLTWTPILNPATPVYTGEMITSLQHDGTRLMAGCSNGVAYFNPTGNPADWTQHIVNPSPPDMGISSMASRPGDPNTIFAVMNDMMHPTVATNALFVSVDAGATWAPVTLPPLITTSIEVIAEDPNHIGYVYIAGDSAQATIYENQSFLDPATWVDITPLSFEHRYPQQIQFHSGLMWTTANTYDVASGTWAPHPDTISGTHVNDGALTFDPDDPNIIFIASDVGVSVSLDGGMTFEERNNGIEAVSVYDVDVDKFTKDVAIVASKSGLAITNVFQKPPTPADWNYPVFPQGNGGPPLSAVAILLDSTTEFLAGDNNESIYKTDDGGLTWREVFHWMASPIESRSMVSDIDHAAGSNTVYASLGFTEEGNDGIILRSDDRGQTWTITNLSAVFPNAIEVVGSHLIYAAVGHERDFPSTTNTGLWVTDDFGATWQQVVNTSGPYMGIATDLAQDPVNPSFQYMTLQINPGTGIVLRLEYDASGLNVIGETDLTMLPGAPIGGHFTAIETNDAGSKVYVGVDQDVYQFDVPTNTWALYSAGLNGETVNVLYWDDLVIGTSTGFYWFDETVPVPVPNWPIH